MRTTRIQRLRAAGVAVAAIAALAVPIAMAAPGAVLVSYCAQGQFRRNLRAAGWLTEKLPGPPGKREMTRARKPAGSSADF